MIGSLMQIKKTDGIVLYGYDACPYTLKMKNELENNNVQFVYKQIDKDSKANEEYQKYNVNGVPLTVNTNTRSHIVGFRSIDDIKKNIL